MSLSRADLLADGKPVIEIVAVPEWATDQCPPADSVVRIRRMSGTERDAYEMSTYEAANGGDKSNMRARLVVRCLCDENGSLITGPEDVNAIGAKDGVALDRISEACQRLNHMGDKGIEKSVGNSEPSPGDAPLSASP